MTMATAAAELDEARLHDPLDGEGEKGHAEQHADDLDQPLRELIQIVNSEPGGDRQIGLMKSWYKPKATMKRTVPRRKTSVISMKTTWRCFTPSTLDAVLLDGVQMS